MLLQQKTLHISLAVFIQLIDNCFCGRVCCVGLQELLKVASSALPFSTDEDGSKPSGINPLASLYDLGRDPLDYYEDKVREVSLSLSCTSISLSIYLCFLLHRYRTI